MFPDTGGKKTALKPKRYVCVILVEKKNPRIVYIEELISFIDQLVPAENLKLSDSWDLISEEAANAVAEVLLQVPATPNGFCRTKTAWLMWIESHSTVSLKPKPLKNDAWIAVPFPF